MEERIPYNSMPELDDKINALEKLIKFMKYDDWAELQYDEDEDYYYYFDTEEKAAIKYVDLLNAIEDSLFGPEELEYARLTDEEKAVILQDLQEYLDMDVEFLL